MRVVSSWADYSIPAIVAITDTGAVYQLPIIDHVDLLNRRGRAFARKWIPLAPAFIEESE